MKVLWHYLAVPTIMHADTLHVLEKGRFIESGRHAELVKRKGLYCAMWRQKIGERPVPELASPEPAGPTSPAGPEAET